MGEVRVIGDEIGVDVVDLMNRRGVEDEEADRVEGGAVAGLLAERARGTGADGVGEVGIGYCSVCNAERVEIEERLCVDLPNGGRASEVNGYHNEGLRDFN